MHGLIPLIIAAGYLGIFAVVFAETGLLIGFFLPGDTLLFSAGILSHEGYFAVAWIIVGTSLAAFLGYACGYWLGEKTGPKIFTREDSLFFKQENVLKTKLFFAKYGNKTMLIAPFVPFVRTFAPVLAGVGDMPRKVFTFYSSIGIVVWSVVVVLLGYYFGARIPHVDEYILPAIALVFVLSLIPAARELVVRRKKRRQQKREQK